MKQRMCVAGRCRDSKFVFVGSDSKGKLYRATAEEFLNYRFRWMSKTRGWQVFFKYEIKAFQLGEIN